MNKPFKTMTAAAFVALTMLATSCNNEDVVSHEDNNYPEVAKLGNADAQKAFAKILSRAVSDSKEVRGFIKTEALAQFDNDHDVFYPFVKDKQVADGKTFRDILLSYCDDEEELIQIEESALLLNILVPDLTLFWDFDAEKWNTDSEEIAVISRDDNTNTLYENGEDIGAISSDQVPGFPCLVVKNNERMVVSNKATRAGNAVYEFADDAYNPSKTGALTRSGEWDMVLETAESGIPYAKASELDPSVITGWNEFKMDATKAQRDYPYYGMTKTNSNGVLRINYAEEILQFRINAAKFGLISDTPAGEPGGDPHLNGSVSPGKGYGSRDAEWILQRIWTDGKFEINFKTYMTPAGSSQGMMTANIQFSVPARYAFSIDKAHVNYTNGTAFRRQHYVYSVNANDLKPRWIHPTQLPGFTNPKPAFTRPWNVSNTSLDFHLFVSEYDASGTTSTTEMIVSEFATEASLGLDVPVGGGVTIKGAFGISSSTTTTNTIMVSRTLTSDDLGMVTFNYKDPVIISDLEKNTKGYQLHSDSNDFVEVVLAPRKRY